MQVGSRAEATVPGASSAVHCVLLMLLGYESDLFTKVSLPLVEAAASRSGEGNYTEVAEVEADGTPPTIFGELFRFYILHNQFSKSQNSMFKWFTDLANVLSDCRQILFQTQKTGFSLKRANDSSGGRSQCVSNEVLSSTLDLLASIEGELAALLNEKQPPSSFASFDSGTSLTSLYRRCRGWESLLNSARDLLVSCLLDLGAAAAPESLLDQNKPNQSANYSTVAGTAAIKEETTGNDVVNSIAMSLTNMSVKAGRLAESSTFEDIAAIKRAAGNEKSIFGKIKEC